MSEEKRRSPMGEHGLDPSMWSVLKEERDRIFFIRKIPEDGAVASIKVFLKEEKGAR